MTLTIATQYEQSGERGTELSKRVSHSLGLQLFCAVLISFAVALSVFGIVFLLGNSLLDRTVYGSAYAESMADLQFGLLQEYIDEEEISLDNLQRLNPWCSRGDKVYLTIYHEGILVYESPLSGSAKNDLNTHEYDQDEEDPDSKYMLTLNDGVRVRAFLYYYAGDAFYFWMTLISGLLSFAAFSVCFVLLVGRKVAYITQLRAELDILSGGQLEYPVTINGKDELGELAAGIDLMRRSIIKHQEMEAQIRSANSELITAMSHDLRTPLTSLLAYLEIIERKKYANDEQMHKLIHKSVGQTMRIKQMADKLFEYFLAYATDWEDAELESIEADPLFHQILLDYTYDLESKGMNVDFSFSPSSVQIMVNISLLQRALENLYSNLLKYADPNKPIKIDYKAIDKNVSITISNFTRTGQQKNESTSIGLITCRRILEYHKGIFSLSDNDDEFKVELSIPIK